MISLSFASKQQQYTCLYSCSMSDKWINGHSLKVIFEKFTLHITKVNNIFLS